MSVWALQLKLSEPAPPVTAVRHYRPGHYLAIGNENSQRDSYTDELTWPGLQGVQFRYFWSQLEPTMGDYSADPILEDLATIASVTTARGTKDGQLIAMIEDKSFKGRPNPLPAYLQPYVSPNVNGGVTVWRWDPFVVDRFEKLLKFLGPFVDNNPNFAGFAIQETAMGFGGAPGHGYTDIKMRDALIAQCLAMANATPHAVAYWYMNFMPSNATDVRLDEVLDAVKGKGVIMGGPDILPGQVYDSDESPPEDVGSTSIEDRAYPRYRNPPKGGFGEIPMFCSMQQDSYRHRHESSSATDNFGLTGYTWNMADFWLMEPLFVWATTAHARSIHVQTVIWENVVTPNQAGSPNTVANAKAVMAKWPTWTVPGADNTP